MKKHSDKMTEVNIQNAVITVKDGKMRVEKATILKGKGREFWEGGTWRQFFNHVEKEAKGD